MVVLISEKYKSAEDGFLLLESLATLTIVLTVILLLNPLVIDWLSSRQTAKELVEENRLIYESSMGINGDYSKNVEDENYSVTNGKNKIRLKEKGTGVFIYEIYFEYE